MEALHKIGRLRWAVLGMLFGVTIINYAVRAALSLAAPSLSKDLGIDPLQLGIVFSAFGWSYVIAQVPGGWLLDRFGAPRVYLWVIVAWSIITVAHGTVVWLSGTAAVTALFALRFLVGLAEAPSFPANARVVASWFPARERGTASAVFNAAQYFATVLFAPLMGWIVADFGWPWVFVAMGGLGLVASLFWPRVVRDPRDHPRLRAGELGLLVEGGALVDPVAQPLVDRAAAKAENRRKMRVLLTTPTLWGLYSGQFFINTLTYFFITWFPVYLVQERGLSVMKAGLFATMPAVCGFIGGVLGGIWSDWLLRRGVSLTWARKVPVVAGMLGALTILGCNFVHSNTLVLLFMSLAFFGKGVGALGWAVVADVAPRDSAGLSGGIFNMFGNISSITTPILIGWILKETGSFDLVLMLVAGSALAAALSYLFLVGKIERIGALA
ncbi:MULTISPECIES: MFS transporter [unclassified Novosphingobium]|uniref:MFS transporter n=2 Tax=unclassified Novosphingobium TaxID=2644732 RepID=UPI00086ED041|nr:MULTISPECIES: MFS transporter [unclassified Novosphingobium]MBN9145369.1 MFS transporter [Novosphingobium sp.]MDR6709891.1 ACS family glucarate transporter-like MFS transporter [Novosphingobium sp. 1748]ODU83164.1 MAG: glucarate transporter [Novosphingobium sp. SCN 63-17]OJX88094.1 MAG: MFS transporter [Novosphingobium sp. 63-713]